MLPSSLSASSPHIDYTDSSLSASTPILYRQNSGSDRSSGSSLGSSDSCPLTADSNSSSSSSRPTVNLIHSVKGTSSGSRPSAPGWKRARGVAPRMLENPGSLVTAVHRQRQTKPYELRPVPQGEMEEICQLLAQHPEFTKKYDFRIQKVHHEVLTKLFEAKIDALKLAADNEALLGSWEGKPEPEIRRSVDEAVKNMSTPTRHSNVFRLTAFHATKKKFLDKVLSSGLQCLARTDKGYFGQGIYSTTFPVYAADIYGGRAGGFLLICQVVFRRLFPVATCDDLMGKPIYPGFDGHAVHVVPKTDNPNEVMFVSRGPWQQAKYDEIVMCDPSHYLTQYVMEYTPTILHVQQMSEKRTRKELRDLILAYMDQNLLDEQFIALNQKLDEVNSSLEKLLDPSDMDLFTLLQRSLGEKEINIQKSLGERIQKLLINEDSIEILAADLPSSFIKEQEDQEVNDENLKRGDAYFHKNEYRKALAEYQQVLKYSPQSFRANVGCGNVYFRLEDWNQAISHFKEALKIKPKDAHARTNYVCALITRATRSIKEKEFAAAARDLREALEYDSINLEALGLFASLYFTKDCFKQAYRMANRALALNPHYAPALRVRGAIYAAWGQGHYEQARKDLSDSIHRQPHPFAFIHRARLYIAMNLLKEAEEDCLWLLKKDSKNLAGLTIRAKIALMSREIKQAEKDLKDCKKKAPDDFAILALLGELCLQKNDLPQALQYLDRGITNYQKLLEKEQGERVKLLKKRDHRDFYDMLLTRAEVHHKRNAVPLALSDYQQAMRLFPDNPVAYQFRGNFYRAKGDKDKAAADYAKAVELEKNNQ